MHKQTFPCISCVQGTVLSFRSLAFGAGCLHKTIKEKGKGEEGEDDYIQLLDFSDLFW